MNLFNRNSKSKEVDNQKQNQIFKSSRFIKREEQQYTVFKITPHVSNFNNQTRKFQNAIYELFSYRYPKYPWHRQQGVRSLNKDNLYLSLKESPKFWWFVKMKGQLADTQPTFIDGEYYVNGSDVMNLNNPNDPSNYVDESTSYGQFDYEPPVPFEPRTNFESTNYSHQTNNNPPRRHSPPKGVSQNNNTNWYTPTFNHTSEPINNSDFSFKPDVNSNSTSKTTPKITRKPPRKRKSTQIESFDSNLIIDKDNGVMPDFSSLQWVEDFNLEPVDDKNNPFIHKYVSMPELEVVEETESKTIERPKVKDSLPTTFEEYKQQLKDREAIEKFTREALAPLNQVKASIKSVHIPQSKQQTKQQTKLESSKYQSSSFPNYNPKDGTPLFPNSTKSTITETSTESSNTESNFLAKTSPFKESTMFPSSNYESSSKNKPIEQLNKVNKESSNYQRRTSIPNYEPEYSQTIEFYVAVPNDFKEAFKTKFYNHEQWRRATLEEVDLTIDFPDVDNTDLYTLQYARNDIFSLKFDYTQQTSPSRDIMSVSRELRDGEEIYLMLQSETVPRMKWKQLSNYAWGIWDKGRVPSKPGINIGNIAGDAGNLLALGFHQVKAILDEILTGVRNSVFDGSDKMEGEKFKPHSSEREALLVNGRLSDQTLHKRNKPVLKTKMMYTVTSKDGVRREMLSRSMANSFMDLNGDNYLKPNKIKINTKKCLEDLTTFKTPPTVIPNLMSTDELGKIEQIPTADLQREFEETLTSNKRVETEMSRELLDPSGILAGTVKLRGEDKEVYIQTKSPEFTSTARAFIGSPRMGKDQAVINLVVESKLHHNMGAVVLDVINERNGHRGMADALRDHLPEDDVVDLDLSDSKNPIYLGLEPIVSTIEDARIASDRISEELSSFLLSDGDEDKLRTIEFLREAGKLTNADVLAIKHLFTSSKFRSKLVKEKENLFDTDIWRQYDEAKGQQASIYTPVMRRIGQILSSELLKPIFCQKDNTKLDLFDLIDKGKVIVFRMKSGVMSQRAIEILCHWITLITFVVKLIQDGKSENNAGTYLVLNEPHQYLTKNLADFIERILVEGPKYRITPVLIFHNFKQFRKYPGFVDMMKTSSLNWHIFKNTNEEVYKDLFKGYLSRTFETYTQAFEATQQFQYIGVWLDSEGAYYDPFVADALPLVTDRYETMDNSHLTIEHSKMYGRPIEEVLEEIKERNRQAPVDIAQRR